MHLHPVHVMKQTAKMLGLSALILLPLLYLNVQFVRKGFKAAQPSFSLNAAQEDEIHSDLGDE